MIVAAVLPEYESVVVDVLDEVPQLLRPLSNPEFANKLLAHEEFVQSSVSSKQSIYKVVPLPDPNHTCIISAPDGMVKFIL